MLPLIRKSNCPKFRLLFTMHYQHNFQSSAQITQNFKVEYRKRVVRHYFKQGFPL